MTDQEKYLKWLHYAIENQEGLLKEEGFGYTLWNKGYLEALLYAKAILNDLSLIDHWPKNRE